MRSPDTARQCQKRQTDHRKHPSATIRGENICGDEQISSLRSASCSHQHETDADAENQPDAVFLRTEMGQFSPHNALDLEPPGTEPRNDTHEHGRTLSASRKRRCKIEESPRNTTSNLVRSHSRRARMDRFSTSGEKIRSGFNEHSD